MAGACEHGAECHDGTEPSLASAPEASRAWLLIEHPGPWPHEAADAALPAPLRALVSAAVLIVAEALHLQAVSDVRELTATLAAELGAVWSVTPSAALLTLNEPRFTFGASG